MKEACEVDRGIWIKVHFAVLFSPECLVRVVLLIAFSRAQTAQRCKEQLGTEETE